MERNKVEGRHGLIRDLSVSLHHPRVTDTVETETADSKTLDEIVRKRIGPRGARKGFVKGGIRQNDRCDSVSPGLYCADDAYRGRVVQRGEDSGALQGSHHAIIHNPGFGNLLAAVDDTVSDYIQRFNEPGTGGVKP